MIKQITVIIIMMLLSGFLSGQNTTATSVDAATAAPNSHDGFICEKVQDGFKIGVYCTPDSTVVSSKTLNYSYYASDAYWVDISFMDNDDTVTYRLPNNVFYYVTMQSKTSSAVSAAVHCDHRDCMNAVAITPTDHIDSFQNCIRYDSESVWTLDQLYTALRQAGYDDLLFEDLYTDIWFDFISADYYNIVYSTILDFSELYYERSDKKPA